MKRSGRWTFNLLLMAAVLIGPAWAAQPSEDPPSTAVVTLVERAGMRALTLAGNTFHETAAEVRNLRTVKVPETAIHLVLWEEVGRQGRAEPWYAISLDGRSVQRVWPTSYVLTLRHGFFDPLNEGPFPVQRGLSADENCHLYIVQFVTQPLPEFRAQIEALGGKVYNYLAYHAHIVKMDAATRAAVAALPYVRWVGPYHPEYRLEEFMRENRALAPELFPVQRYCIQVFEEGLKQKAAVAERIRQIGGKVDAPNFGKYLLVATLTPEQLWEVVHWDEVLFVDRWSPYEKDMDIVREYGGANYIETVAGFTGQGVRGEAFDAGCQTSHQEFQARPLLVHGTVGVDSHGTATAGVCFASGVDPQARGLLPDGQGVVGSYQDVGLYGPSRYAHTGEQIQAPYYCVFETASVGSDRTTQYTTISADTDAMLFDFDVVHCQSQSNAGDQMSRPQAWAKNIISGGAVNHYDTLDPSDDCWCYGASIGPATDGRIKPDLCAYYDEIYTTYSTSTTGYGQFGGTSGATPIIAGHVGLLFQMWSEGLFGNEVYPPGGGPTGYDVFDNRCHMTTAKAMLINNATQYPFSGTSHDLTRVHQGWGWPNVQRIYDLRDKIFVIDETEVLEPFEVVTYPLSVEPGEPELRATLVYADPPGNPSSGRHRINDLTLKVISPSGDYYWGNHGLLANNYSVPNAGGPNTVDTVENVFVLNPESGTWLVEVHADEIIEDSHVETEGVLDADFALVVSGVVPCLSRGSIRLDGGMYPCAANAELRVLDCDLNTDDQVAETVSVTIASDSEPAGETVVLTETAPATAIFLGSIALSTTDADGVLLVADGDTIVATYVDEDDGMGGTFVEVTDEALVDCQAPTITNVTATNIQPRTADITFDADEPVKATVFYGQSCGALTEIASNAAFSVSPVVTLTGLTDNTTYYFAVQAEDAAGNLTYDDNGGACYSFTTPEVPDFFTELLSPNDLEGLMLKFEPNGSNDFYMGCVEEREITELPTDPAGGTTLPLSDDDSEVVNVTGGNMVHLYGVAYTAFYVGSNGYITFGGSDTDYTESLEDHFDMPRISALFDDLNPSSGGTVSYKQLEDRVAVTWQGVPEYGTSNSNTFQVELFFNGDIRISYLGLDATDGLAGLSEGNGLDPDYYPSDLSEMGPCGPRPPTATSTSIYTPISTPFSLELIATDDGLPDPPGALTYIITLLPEHGQLTDPQAGAITSVPYTLVNGGHVVEYQPTPLYQGADAFRWKANDGGTPPDGGDSNTAIVDISVGGSHPVYVFHLDEDPGWSTEGQWAFGVPTGQSGSDGNPDPTSGFTGSNVYGYNLNGGYTNDMPRYYLTTNALDCTGLYDVELHYYRWLGVDAASMDHAGVEVSNDGVNWVTVWEHLGYPLSEVAWSHQVHNISAVADNQPTVYIRWGMGTTDSDVTYCGWNLDDIEIWGTEPPQFGSGDLNCDGVVNAFDIDPFILALTDPAAYQAAYPGCDLNNADINGDGQVNAFDIDPFIDLLTG